MKKLLPIFISICILLTACGAPSTDAAISNLADEGSRELLREALRQGSVPEESIAVFLSDVALYNETIENAGLIREGFSAFDLNRRDYDFDIISELWGEMYPSFLGYNCKITAFTLLKDTIDVSDCTNASPSELDMLLQQSPEHIQNRFTNEDIAKFDSLFLTSEYPKNADTEECADIIIQAWQDAGVSFSQNTSCSLICVFVNGNVMDKQDVLFAEHAGVLLPDPTGGYYFIEKLSFQNPYQAIHFTERSDLRRYLQKAYADEYDICFITENDHVFASEGTNFS